MLTEGRESRFVRRGCIPPVYLSCTMNYILNDDDSGADNDGAAPCPRIETYEPAIASQQELCMEEAKKFEEVFVPGRQEPIIIPRGSEALFMLQRVRDEAHRFANTFHRELRGKRMVSSQLDGIAGLGEVRAKRLVKEMKGVNAVKNASREDLALLSWLPSAVADAIHSHFHPDI